MKILHIISDWKWTGPAEPVVSLCAELQRRGHDVTLAIAKVHGDNHPVLREKALERGVRLFEGLTLRRRVNLAALRDIITLAGYIRREEFDVVHTHLTHDHALAALALRENNNTKLVRTSHKGVPLKNNMGNRFLMKRTGGLITVSERARETDISVFSLPPEKVVAIQNVTDLVRFVPRQKKHESMKELGINPDNIIVGIVARLQRHRRFEVFFKAIKLASMQVPNLKAIVVGRGTYMEEVAVQPVKDMDLEETVILAGYRKDDYLDVISLFDMNVFLVPGSDGSCRAVRELMAMGKPVIAANRGMLPEIVDDGINGLIIGDTPEKLANAIIKLAKNKSMRGKMGNNAASKALSSFSLTMQGEMVEKFYSKLL